MLEFILLHLGPMALEAAGTTAKVIEVVQLVIWMFGG